MYLYSAISRLWIYSVFIHFWTFTNILSLFISGLLTISVFILFWPLYAFILLYSFLAFTYILSLFFFGLGMPIFCFFTSGLYLYSALFISGLYLYSVFTLFWPLPLFCLIHFWPLPIFCLYSFLAFTYILLYSFLAFTYILSLFISFLFCLLSYFLQYYPPANECNKIFISILYLSPPTYEQHQNLLEDWLEHVLLFKHRANLCIGWLVLQIIKHFSLAANALAYSDHTTLLSKIHWMIFRVERIAN